MSGMWQIHAGVNGKTRENVTVCQDRECGHKETISRHTNARRPVCHKKMVGGKGDGQRDLSASAGHKEKTEFFFENEKKKKEKAQAKDVNHYLRKQAKKQRAINTALCGSIFEDSSYRVCFK